MRDPRPSPTRAPIAHAFAAARRFAVVGLVAVAAGCVAAVQPLELTPWDPPTGQRCDPYHVREPLDQLVDTAGLRAFVAAAALDDGALVASVIADTAGGGGWVIESMWDPPTTERVREGLLTAVRPDPEGSRRFRALMRVGGGELVEAAVGPGELCRPVMVNEDEVVERLQQVHGVIGRLGRANIWLRIDTTGVVTEGQVNQSSGDVFLDRTLLTIGQTAVFHPAWNDGRKQAIWVAIDFTMQQGRIVFAERGERVQRRP